MALKEAVIKYLDEIIAETDYYLVDVVVSESKIRKKITVYIDSDEGIQIDQCGKVSQALGKELEEIIEDAFVLEVSSPGADSPLKFERQYFKNIGRTIKVTLNDLSEVKGQLLSIKDGIITILPEAKKKIKPVETTLEIENIKEAKVVISFK
ncbi:ribosome maturation factor RimP [Lacihabitans sp. LS3-19]|uniref:ribosome maturation factor RimP n=1 Tax=Lacihabitans sp. LS3-19 TaxID=2487335 RepID=UPI0020CD0BE1|nr:ribosome maturation factor RimP [Lacihabitans sp. LS3-19]MCP9766751.1 ribosome maturation factor RimP [Lacihabitans sp. LS3-19]